MCEKPLSNAQGRGLCEANAGYAPRGWSADDVALRLLEIGVILEALLRRYSWKKMPQIYNLISYGPDARWRNRIADRIAEPCSAAPSSTLGPANLVFVIHSFKKNVRDPLIG